MLRLRGIPHIISYDNASFHGIIKDHLPKSNVRKAKLANLMDALGHEVTSEEYLRMELMDMFKQYQRSGDEQIIDRLAKHMCHIPLKIPPYYLL